MTMHDKRLAKTHDDILEAMAEALAIPPSKLEEARSRYEAIGNWLDRPESTLADYDPAISPQGSFLLGTVTRPLTDAEEYDVDLVCRLNATKAEFTQKSLKDAVGYEVGLYAKAHGMTKPDDGRRCWTLNYAAGAQFHMDILPALPDAQRYQTKLLAEGYRTLAHDSALSGHAIAITDKTLPHYDQPTEDWPQSNPTGYGAWFRNRMLVQLTESKKAFAKRERITASVDEIPDYKVKTPLQRAVQLLKRHRDCMFAEDCEHKPISIIITTLSAHAYNEETTISGALQSILTVMDRYIEDRGGAAWVANPVNPAENFADKWAEEPKKSENFDRWLGQARQDFALYLRANAFDKVPELLREHLGPQLVDRAMAAVLPVAAAGLAAPAIITSAARAEDVDRAQHAVDQINRAGPQSKPWARS
ncbi:nucleotidyltransferase [Mesorhizobium sp. B4-1-3]|uniref:nucleotidyltransferase domain-containing protein n=1 Tax=Mesorhizobium sp. B4-1-3 TaxID=2589889 RepID=UPI001125CB31|nr:nucleotidyltransferase [Mesorhizobium sp. B4-1-3]TPI12218.1 nucleotidyltransferase [Mesorhizobium sp. B4-1-3]